MCQQFIDAVNHSNGHGYSSPASVNGDPGDTQVNGTGFQGIYASRVGSVITLENGLGGDDSPTGVIENVNGFDQLTSISFGEGTTAAFNTTTGQGSGKGVRSGLLGWWRFKGPSIDPNITQLQISPKRVNYSSGSIGTETPPNAPFQVLHSSQSSAVSAVINVGGTYVFDSPDLD